MGTPGGQTLSWACQGLPKLRWLLSRPLYYWDVACHTRDAWRDLDGVHSVAYTSCLRGFLVSPISRSGLYTQLVDVSVCVWIADSWISVRSCRTSWCYHFHELSFFVCWSWLFILWCLFWTGGSGWVPFGGPSWFHFGPSLAIGVIGMDSEVTQVGKTLNLEGVWPQRRSPYFLFVLNVRRSFVIWLLCDCQVLFSLDFQRISGPRRTEKQAKPSRVIRKSCFTNSEEECPWLSF